MPFSRNYHFFGNQQQKNYFCDIRWLESQQSADKKRIEDLENILTGFTSVGSTFMVINIFLIFFLLPN